MIAAWVKALLFVGGGLTAAAGTAYVTGMLDPWLASPPQTMAALPPDAKAPVEEQAPPAEATVPQPDDPQTTPKQARLQPPSFDLLRVEPDGSVLIAGKATPEVFVEVLHGETVIAATTATPAGDFVAVLDVPLEPGDYQLSLRATLGEDVATSTQTAIVSIPETSDGEVLAMVEEPGKPAEIITAPAGAETPEGDGPSEIAAVEQEQDVASAPAEEPAAPETPIEEDAAADAPASPPLPAEVASDEEQSAEEEVAAAEDPETNEEPANGSEQDEQPADEEVAVAPIAEPAASQDQTNGEDNAAADQPAPAETAVTETPDPNQPAPVEEEVGDGEEDTTDQEIASLPVEDEQPAVPDQPVVEGVVVVEAVEIEGGTVFVAGSATPGRTVRVYANSLLLGDSKASEGGRFLVEARRDLPVGDYVIRADLLAADGTVVSRAAVPFEREPGEAIAAVAVPPEQAPSETMPDAGATAPEAPANQQDEQVAAEIVPQDDAPAGQGDQEMAPAPVEADDAAPAEQDVAAAPAQPQEQDAPAQPADGGVASPPEEMAEDQPDDVAQQPAEQSEVDVAAAPPADEEAGLTAPKLQKVDGAVIIRRGDNLWRISRRVYGMGVRYSTIYLANQDQISDPDRIWPGQVFSVPQETAEGEAADLEAMGEQVVPPDTESKIIR